MSPHLIANPHPFRSRLRKRQARSSAIAVTAELLETRKLLSSYVVTNLSDSGSGSLRDAVTQANQSPGSDTVTFARKLTGIIVLTSGELEVSDDLMISGPGANALTVSGNNQSRIFEVDANVTAAISGVTLANGRAPFPGFFGGAIVNFGVLTVTDSTVAANHTGGLGFGGGIDSGLFDNPTARLTVNGCTFSGNGASAGGGGIESFGSLVVTNSTFTNNGGGGNGIGSGGGIQNQGVATVADSTFPGNSGWGAGIGNSAGTLNVTRCTFSNNHGVEGGGLLNDGTLPVSYVSDSTFSGNTAASGGGACANSSILILTDTTLSGNSGHYSGGGIDNFGTLTVTDSALTNNSANEGGGIDNEGNATLTDIRLTGNTARVGGGITSYSTLTVTDSKLTNNSATSPFGNTSPVCNAG